MFKKILIADDHSVVRIGVSFALESYDRTIEIDFAESYFEIEQILSQKPAELLIMDIQMPGIERNVIREIKRTYPSLKVLLFSAYSGDVVLQYITEGADGYLNKQCSSSQITEAVKTLYETGFVIPPDTAHDILRLSDKINPERILSDREYEIFMLFVQGMGNLEITNTLSIKPGTVSTYKKRIFEKLKVKSIADLVKIHIGSPKM